MSDVPADRTSEPAAGANRRRSSTRTVRVRTEDAVPAPRPASAPGSPSSTRAVGSSASTGDRDTHATAPRSDDPERPAPRPVVPDTRAGDAIIRTSLGATALFTVSAIAATVAYDALRVPAAIVALGLFAAGCAVFFVAYAAAIGRSRRDALGVGGWFFLAGTAPKRVQRLLNGSLAVQVVVAITTASIRSYTTLAFGILTPVSALALSGLWGARHGVFPPRTGSDESPSRPGTGSGLASSSAPAGDVGQNAGHG